MYKKIPLRRDFCFVALAFFCQLLSASGREIAENAVYTILLQALDIVHRGLQAFGLRLSAQLADAREVRADEVGGTGGWAHGKSGDSLARQGVPACHAGRSIQRRTEPVP